MRRETSNVLRLTSYVPPPPHAIFTASTHPSSPVPRLTPLRLVPSNTAVQELEDKVAKLQRAVYYLIWKRTGFGEQCVHCGHSYPGHAERCKAAEVEALVR